ncbi:MAG TPA: DUF5777 family beta-barrel protein [Saprospiraceae bacterium]|nr:DUF5777 family beta-barrel protein [Saprospiraceae bacterium]
MKNSIDHIFQRLLKTGLCVGLMLCFTPGAMLAQVEGDTVITNTKKPVKNTFESVWIIDNQTVMVPIKGTFEMDIQHRFGTVENGYDDFWGIFAPGNIRLGFNYAPISKLYVGFGITKERLQWDFNIKYALLQQMQGGGMPVSLTYYGNMVVDTRDKENFVSGTDRLSYFHQLILARKVTNAFSVQVSPSLSYYNNVEGYVDENGDIQKKMENAHFAISFAGRYKVTESMAILAGVDQPLTQHTTNNPYPNICFGIEIATSSHAFQVFAGNFSSIVPQSNNVFNQNDYENGQFLIGFNITKLWNW